MLAASERVLASICEAVIGAAYLAFGIERVAPAVVAAFDEAIEGALENPVDHKSVLQERLAQRAETVDVPDRGPGRSRARAQLRGGGGVRRPRAGAGDGPDQEGRRAGGRPGGAGGEDGDR